MFGIGISSGGSFTDAVIMDLKNWHVVSKAKSPTTYNDFSIGIINSLDKVLASSKVHPEEIGLLSLATTLATNAIIENKGGKVSLFLLGFQQSDMIMSKPENSRDLPVHNILSFKGGHGPDGIEICPLDLDAIEDGVKGTKDAVDSFAVSGLFSVRNPIHEMTVKRIISRHTDKPVVCGFELAGKLGIYERTVTAVLNARIMPIVERLILSVKNAMSQRNICAPLMLVRGDGALMNDAVAMERAIETIQSGPAASVIGGKFLSSKEDVVVMDIGSTTTIICSVKAGAPKIDESGATIAGWKTRVRAVDADALGNGGDSWITIDSMDVLKVGPRRVIPLAFASKDFPSLKGKMQQFETVDFFSASKAMRKPDAGGLSQKLFDAVSNLEPAAMVEIKKELKNTPIDLLIGMLEDSGYMARIGLTPTDLMHMKGLFTLGDADASKLGIGILAKRLNITQDQLYERVWDLMIQKNALRMAELQTSLGNNIMENSDKPNLAVEILDSIIRGSLGDISVSCSLNVPIVGIGAPAQFFIPQIAERLKTESIIPQHYEVGAAVGSLVGNVVSTFDLLVRKEVNPECYVVFPGRHVFSDLESAAEFAIKMGKEEANKQAEKTGAIDIEFKVKREDKVFPKIGFMWSDIRVTATGRPALESKEHK
jgi:N-methylhydantoinase A/oxoprolinase/acetone carboxylase beta subunit